MSTTSQFVARVRLEQALMNLQRRTTLRTPTRSERRLQAHYEQQLQALDEQENHD